MKMRLGILAIVIAASFLVGDAALSQGQEHDPQKMMAKMKEAMNLTEHHRAMKDLIGQYDVTIEVKMPGVPVARGTAEIKWLMPGRWACISMKVPGFMGQGDYEAFVIMGYDKIKKKYVSAVVNSMSPGMITMEGVVVDPTGKVRVQYGTLDEYLTGEHDKQIKLVTRQIDKDTFINEVWDLGIGETGKAVFVETFTRRKEK